MLLIRGKPPTEVVNVCGNKTCIMYTFAKVGPCKCHTMDVNNHASVSFLEQWAGNDTITCTVYRRTSYNVLCSLDGISCTQPPFVHKTACPRNTCVSWSWNIWFFLEYWALGKGEYQYHPHEFEKNAYHKPPFDCELPATPPSLTHRCRSSPMGMQSDRTPLSPRTAV